MDFKVINSIRSLALDMIDEAGSGYPGITLDAAPMLYVLFAYHLNFNKDNGTWINRDRFILSSTHASALLYSLLFYSGYPITIEDLKKYGKVNGNLKETPKLNPKIGIEFSSGVSAEGLASAIGICMGQAYLKECLGKEIINNYTYVLVTEADLMEGISYEAASLAGSLNLSNLIVLYDSNKTTMDGKTKNIFDENVLKRFEAMGWNTELVINGEDIISINKAINHAKNVRHKPSIIEIKTKIGIGSINEGTNKVYYGTLSLNDLNNLKEKMNMTKVPFHISKEAIKFLRNKQDERNIKNYNNWLEKYNKIIEYDKYRKNFVENLENNELKIDIKNLKITFDENLKEDFRVTNSNLMNVISKMTEFFIGGSADVSTINKTYLKNEGKFLIDNKGKNINYGVREYLMGFVSNGLALCNLRPFASTNLISSDIIKPSMRYSSIMNLPVTYIFTYNSTNYKELGQDIEHLANIRSIPNMFVFRPADVNELVASWHYILNSNKPCALLISSEDKEMLQGSSVVSSLRGAYIIKKENGRLSGILISTGSEVKKSLIISDELENKGIYTRVISMPSIELFNLQSEEYKNSLFEVGIKVITIEKSNDKVWNEFVYNKKYIINVNNNLFNIDLLIDNVENLLK